MDALDATSAGIMAMEAAWVLVAHLKQFITHTLSELRSAVTPGQAAWTNAIRSMSSWNRDVIQRHFDVKACCHDYRAVAIRYLSSTQQQAGRARIASIGLFLETFVRLASEHPYIRTGQILDLAPRDVDHVIVDLLRTTLSTSKPPRQRQQRHQSTLALVPEDSVSVAVIRASDDTDDVGEASEIEMSRELYKLVGTNNTADTPTPPLPDNNDNNDNNNDNNDNNSNVTENKCFFSLMRSEQEKQNQNKVHDGSKPRESNHVPDRPKALEAPLSMAETFAGR